MEQRLGVGATLSEAFSIYRNQAGVLLPVAFWLFLAVGVIEALAADDVGLSLLALVVGIALSTLYQGMVVGLVSDVRDGRRDSSIAELVRSVTPVLGRLIGAGILAGLGIVGGFALLIVPGLYLLTIWAVVAPVIVVERRPVFDAFGRSRQLVRQNGWSVLGALASAYLITFAVAAAAILLAVRFSEGILVEIVFGALAATLTAPILALVAAVLYFRLLAIKDEESSVEGPAAVEPPQS